MSEQSLTETTTHDDGSYVRTALVLDSKESDKGNGSATVAVVTDTGRFLALLNIFCHSDGSWLAVDVIDTAEQFNCKRALIFQDGYREDMETTGNLVAADFRKEQ